MRHTTRIIPYILASAIALTGCSNIPIIGQFTRDGGSSTESQTTTNNLNINIPGTAQPVTSHGLPVLEMFFDTTAIGDGGETTIDIEVPDLTSTSTADSSKSGAASAESTTITSTSYVGTIALGDLDVRPDEVLTNLNNTDAGSAAISDAAGSAVATDPAGSAAAANTTGTAATADAAGTAAATDPAGSAAATNTTGSTAATDTASTASGTESTSSASPTEAPVIATGTAAAADSASATADKHSYNIRLRRASTICGIENVQEFALLANAEDPSLLHHVIYTDLAEDFGFTVAPSQLVEIYINNDYQGVYALTVPFEDDPTPIPEDRMNAVLDAARSGDYDTAAATADLTSLARLYLLQEFASCAMPVEDAVSWNTGAGNIMVRPIESAPSCLGTSVIPAMNQENELNLYQFGQTAYAGGTNAAFFASLLNLPEFRTRVEEIWRGEVRRMLNIEFDRYNDIYTRMYDAALADHEKWPRASAYGDVIRALSPWMRNREHFLELVYGDHTEIAEGDYRVVLNSNSRNMAAANAASDSAEILTESMNYGMSQVFHIRSAGGGFYTLQNLHSGLYLTDGLDLDAWFTEKMKTPISDEAEADESASDQAASSETATNGQTATADGQSATADGQATAANGQTDAAATTDGQSGTADGQADAAAAQPATVLTQQPGTNTPAQQWLIISNGDTTYRLLSKRTFLAISGERSGSIFGSAAAHTPEVQNVETSRTMVETSPLLFAAATGDPAESFLIESAGMITNPLDIGEYRIMNGGKCLGIAGNSLDEKANVQLQDPNGTDSQVFIFRKDQDGYYTIINKASGRVLDIEKGLTDNKTNIWQYHDNGTQAQRWAVIANVDGSYTIYSKASGKVIDIAGGRVENGTNIQIYRRNGSDAQRFTIE